MTCQCSRRIVEAPCSMPARTRIGWPVRPRGWIKCHSLSASYSTSRLAWLCHGNHRAAAVACCTAATGRTRSAASASAVGVVDSAASAALYVGAKPRTGIPRWSGRRHLEQSSQMWAAICSARTARRAGLRYRRHRHRDHIRIRVRSSIRAHSPRADAAGGRSAARGLHADPRPCRCPNWRVMMHAHAPKVAAARFTACPSPSHGTFRHCVAMPLRRVEYSSVASFEQVRRFLRGSWEVACWQAAL
jgi:hypothetical protein